VGDCDESGAVAALELAQDVADVGGDDEPAGDLVV